MWSLSDLRVPLIAAPMAGGPSTPSLVSAVATAGGMGFLAAGYQSAEGLAEQIGAARATGTDVFGVNVFIADRDQPAVHALRVYRDRLQPLADRYGVGVLPQPQPDDDAWAEKVALLLDDPVPVVSFTFGLPDPATVDALHQVDTHVIATITNLAEGRAARDRGVDSLCVQGPDAGGHRATFATATPAGETTLLDLLPRIRDDVGLPVIAAGGLTAPAQVASAIHGADAVQLGTAYLLCEEAGTNGTHRIALRDPRFTETTVTRAFSGRLARALRNRFIDEFGTHAPVSYPGVNQITSPIRKAAARSGDAEYTHLWAGAGWRDAREGSAADITRDLWERVLRQAPRA